MRGLVLAAALALAGAEALARTEPDVKALNARAHAEAVKLAFHRLQDLIRRRSAASVSWPDDVPPATLGGVNTGWLDDWTRRGVRARYCTDDPAVPGTLLVWLNPARAMGVGTDHRSVRAAPRLYGRERRTLHWLDGGVAEGGDGRHSVALPACMTGGLPSGRAALAGTVEDPWVASGPRAEWERRDAACPAGTHRPPALPAAEPARVERRRVTRQFNRRGVEVGAPVFGPWQVSVDLCERDHTVTETETQSCTYTIEGQSAVGYKIVTRRKTVSASGDTYTPWVELFSTCWSGPVASIPPPAGTPERLPRPTITFPTWVETEPRSCPACFDGSAFRWRRHTDRHVRFPWDSQPTIQTDVNVTNWITDRSGCTPTPPAVLGRETGTATRTRSCARGWSGTYTQSRQETYRREVPCGGSERRVFESATGWAIEANNCARDCFNAQHGDPQNECYGNSGGGDDSDSHDSGSDGDTDGTSDGGNNAAADQSGDDSISNSDLDSAMDDAGMDSGDDASGHDADPGGDF